MPSRDESRISQGCHRPSSISRRWRALREAALAQAGLGHGAPGIAPQQTACKQQPRHPLPFINGPFPVSISFSNLTRLTLLRVVLISYTLRVLNVANGARLGTQTCHAVAIKRILPRARKLIITSADPLEGWPFEPQARNHNTKTGDLRTR
jgi:hypothetical protein